MKQRTLFATIVLSALAFAACSKSSPQSIAPAYTPTTDKVLVANVGQRGIKGLVIATNQGQVLWEGDLQAAQQMSFTFTPPSDGHFVVKYSGLTSTPQELHKGYFTTKGGLLHSFTFDAAGLKQRTRRNTSTSTASAK
jgi:hypothetical protein